MPLSILILFITPVNCLSCDDVLALPTSKNLFLADLQSMMPKEIVKCLPHLGREQMPVAETEFIWKSIIQYHEGVSNIPESVLMQLHWITPAIKTDQYANISLSSIDVVQNFGLNYKLDDSQLFAIAERVREEYAGKQPEDYTFYDLTALRQILCVFNRSEIERIHPSAYKEAALLIGKLESCSSDVMIGFATLAVQDTAFGLPKNWSEATLETIGAVAEYIPGKRNNEKSNE